LRYRFCSAAQIARLAGGNEKVAHRRLRRLWEHGLVTRWAFPGFRTHSEFYYYLDNREPLDLLAERRRLEIHPQMLEEIRSHREKDYAGAAIRGQHMQLGFLNHGLMISRMHFMVEMACRKSGGDVALEAWCQGGQIAGHKVDVPKVRSSKQGGQLFWQEVAETERLPVEPDALFTLRFTRRPDGQQLAHFFYEADRGTMIITDMLKKFRGYHHFIKKQQRHNLAGDGIKVAKAGRKMPGVKKLHQQSESNTKPEYIFGHSCQAVAVLTQALSSVFALPLACRIHEGTVFSNRDHRTLLDKMILLIDSLGIQEPFYFVADAYYATGNIVRGLLAHGNHLVTRVKSNSVAFFPATPPPPHRPRPKGRPAK
jgi:hypothetical protein